jgi:hypothetical protein
MSKLALFVIAALILSEAAFAQSKYEVLTPCQRVVTAGLRVPEDFVVSVNRGPRLASRGNHFHAEIQASGKVLIEEERRSDSKLVKITSNRTISEQAVRKLFATVIACKFFALKNSYSRPKPKGGVSTSISVMANGKRHSVTVSHYTVTRFDAMISAIDDCL